jgi:hypothetical protein
MASATLAAATVEQRPACAPPAAAEHPGALTVYVVATSDTGTRAAVRAAKTLGAGLSIEIVLIVPHVVPYPLALDPAAPTAAHAVSRSRMLAESIDAPVSINICVCRPGPLNAAGALPPGATVVVGGRRRRWWPTPAERLAHGLTQLGHRVVFADSRRLSAKAA